MYTLTLYTCTLLLLGNTRARAFFVIVFSRLKTHYVFLLSLILDSGNLFLIYQTRNFNLILIRESHVATRRFGHITDDFNNKMKPEIIIRRARQISANQSIRFAIVDTPAIYLNIGESRLRAA